MTGGSGRDWLQADDLRRVLPFFSLAFALVAAITQPSSAADIALTAESEKKGHGAITVAVADFLADLRLSGSERVLGALALSVADGMDASPPYAKGRLARELRDIIAELAEAELSPANLSLL